MSEVIFPSLPATQEQSTTVLPHRVEEITKEILQQKDQIVCSFIQIGKLLDEAKGQLKKDGQWLKWLETSVDISVRMAQRYIQLARAFPDATSVTHLGMTKALALLALPEAQREQFISEPHDVDGTPKKLSEMSVREIRRAIHEQAKPADEADGSSKAETTLKFYPIFRDQHTTVILNRQRDMESSVEPSDLGILTPDLESLKTHLDSILRILDSQAIDNISQDKISNELQSLHEKIQKCLSLMQKPTD